MCAVKRFTDEKWILLYVERWLKAPVLNPAGEIEARREGTPQGGVISPLLANIFLHLAFDSWMLATFPQIAFERYADDIVVHCLTKKQAIYLRDRIQHRLRDCRLELHPDKTKIVYCKKSGRGQKYPDVRFTFPGYDFEPHWNLRRTGWFTLDFTPQVSRDALKEMRQKLREQRLYRRSDLSLKEVSERINPMLHGWITYFGKYRKSALSQVFHHLNGILLKWAMRSWMIRAG